MRSGTSTTGDQLSICINRPGMPDDEERRENLLHDVEMAVEAVLNEYDLDPTFQKTIDGHVYASVEDDCPVCGERLQLIEPTLDSSNGAFATASCECGWYGEAVYRLIDLHEIQSGFEDDAEMNDSNESEALIEDNSCVRRYAIRPQYTPY